MVPDGGDLRHGAAVTALPAARESGRVALGLEGWLEQGWVLIANLVRGIMRTVENPLNVYWCSVLELVGGFLDQLLCSFMCTSTGFFRAVVLSTARRNRSACQKSSSLAKV